MSLTTLEGGRQRYERSAAHYSVEFPVGWTVDTTFARHDFRATATPAIPGIACLDVFTQFLPDLAGAGPEDFLDNFGHADFDGMVRSSFHDDFQVTPRGETPVRQRMIAGRVWFVGDYGLVGRTTGKVATLRYAMAFERGTFYHLKGYLSGDDHAAGEAAMERVLESFRA